MFVHGTAISGGVDISEFPGCHLLQQMSSQCGSQKLIQGLGTHELTTHLSLLTVYLFKFNELWSFYQKHVIPDNFESHNSLKLSFTNIQDLRVNFVDCESFLDSNSPDILALCETNLDDSIDSGNFSVRGYLPLIQKDSSTHMQ